MRGQSKPILFAEQWAVLVAAATVLLLGIDWGLPSAQRRELLLDGYSLSLDERRLLAEVRQKKRATRDARLAEAADALVHGGGFRQVRGDTLVAILSKEDKLDALCSFVIHSSAEDEELAYSSLSRIDPRRFDFSPRYFFYGGAYLYPLGAMLFLLKALGIVHVTNDYAYYLDHPGAMSLIYQCGRLLNVLAFLGTIVLLARLGGKLGGRKAGSAAALTYFFSTLALNQSLVSKPHVFAAFWALLSVVLAVRHRQGGGWGSLLGSGAAAGMAVGSSLTAGTMALVFPFLLIDGRRLTGSICRTVVAWITMAVGFLATNPYALVHFDRYLYTMVEASRTWGFGVVQARALTDYVWDLLTRANCFPVSVVGAATIVVAALRGKDWPRRLAVATLALLIVSGSSLTGQRVTLFIGPLLALFAGAGWAAIASWEALRPLALCRLLAAALFLPGAVFAALFARDVIWDRSWYEPTRAWVRSAGLDETKTIGFFGRSWANEPHPTDSPPFPLLRPRLVNMVRYKDADDLPDFVIVGVYADNRKLWESHSLRRYYELRSVLGFRESDEWLPSWRSRNLSAIAAWVYVPRSAPEGGS